jgi:hypothetical protein
MAVAVAVHIATHCKTEITAVLAAAVVQEYLVPLPRELEAQETPHLLLRHKVAMVVLGKMAQRLAVAVAVEQAQLEPQELQILAVTVALVRHQPYLARL